MLRLLSIEVILLSCEIKFLEALVGTVQLKSLTNKCNNI